MFSPDEATKGGTPENGRRIVRAGENCWRVERSDLSSFLIDGQAYFSALAQTFPLARERIWIIGWDFDPWIKLTPRVPDAPKLGQFLRQLIEQHSRLEVRLLIWAMGPLYSGKSLDVFKQQDWADHQRIVLAFDGHHPLRASHHQKIVCVDDAVAFVGGIDLTAGRWDTPRHPAQWRWRKKPSGDRYPPVHDVQAMVSGSAASAVAEIASARWRRATGETVSVKTTVARLPWPPAMPPDLSDCAVAIARTQPSRLWQSGRREAAKLTREALTAARQFLYIETQYLASFRVARHMRASLKKPDGPEILVVLSRSSRGMLEQFVMAHNRNRLIRRLKRADTHNRLRVLCPCIEGPEGKKTEILIHSKVIIADDSFARIGSSNLNNRSEGLDTECDIAFEAENAQHRMAIAGLRNQLLAEHLGTNPDTVAREISRTGSVFAAVDHLGGGSRKLEDIGVSVARGKTTPLPATALLDPQEPYMPLRRLFRWLQRWVSDLFRR